MLAPDTLCAPMERGVMERKQETLTQMLRQLHHRMQDSVPIFPPEENHTSIGLIMQIMLRMEKEKKQSDFTMDHYIIGKVLRVSTRIRILLWRKRVMILKAALQYSFYQLRFQSTELIQISCCINAISIPISIATILMLIQKSET